MVNLKTILKKLLDLINLTKIYAFYIDKILKIVIINK